MSRSDRMISIEDVKVVIEKGEIIEDYPDNARGHSCLIFGYSKEKRPIHVVCSPKENYLAIITAYIPDHQQWDENFKTRKLK